MSIQMLRTSERTSFKRCPQRWWWGTVEGLTPIRMKNPLWFGIGIHQALAEWYLEGSKRGPHPAETWTAFCEDEERFIPTDYEEDGAKYVDAVELGVSMCNEYVKLYGKDSHWNVISTEQTFRQLIADPRYKPEPGGKLKALVRYVGTFDGVYRDLRNGKIYLMEHKTAAGIQTRHLPLDDQAGSYWMVAGKILRKQGLIGPRESLEGIMYNFLRKSLPDDRKRNEKGEALNKDGSVSKRQPAPAFLRELVERTSVERKKMQERIQAEALHMAAMRNGDLPVYKKTTKDCDWDCDFYKMCIMDEGGGDVEEYKDAMYVRRDTYADHRENRKSA
jgi:PD-(D/E)XK nuclease superfamily